MDTDNSTAVAPVATPTVVTPTTPAIQKPVASVPRASAPAQVAPAHDPGTAPTPEPLVNIDTDTDTPDEVEVVPSEVISPSDTALIQQLSGGHSIITAVLFVLFVGNSLATRFFNEKQRSRLSEVQEELEDQVQRLKLLLAVSETEIQQLKQDQEFQKAKLASVDAALTTHLIESSELAKPVKAKSAKTTRKPRAKKS